jgi:hypothetical protein
MKFAAILAAAVFVPLAFAAPKNARVRVEPSL